MHALLRIFAITLALVAASPTAQAQATPERSRENFMVVVRESLGANRSDDVFVPTGKAKMKLPDGKEVEIDMASWQFIGDTHIRFVFDGPSFMINATTQDLERLGLKTVDEALNLAISNFLRAYGEPTAKPWEGGLMDVTGRSPDLNSSYFLYRSYWQELQRTYPEGLVVCVAKRGGLLYTPLSNTKAVDALKRGVAYLYSSSERLRVSSALFLFKDSKWSVFQAPIKQ